MRFDKFTVKAQEAIATSQQLAMSRSHTIVTPLHLLHRAEDEQGLAPVLLKHSVPAASASADHRKRAERLPTGTVSGQMIMPDQAYSQILLDAQNKADKMGDEFSASNTCSCRWRTSPARPRRCSASTPSQPPNWKELSSKSAAIARSPTRTPKANTKPSNATASI